MAAMIWDEQSQAFVETTNTPKRYDAESGAWVETTGMAWDEQSQAWTERWNNGAYVYGAALETVTIKKNGIIVATVATDSTGQSTEQIGLAYGIYTLTGSVSGWTEEQAVDEHTTKFRAMPEGALYWYGVLNPIMTPYCEAYNGTTYSFETNSLYLYGYNNIGFGRTGIKTVEKINLTGFSKLVAKHTFIKTKYTYNSDGFYISTGSQYGTEYGNMNIDDRLQALKRDNSSPTVTLDISAINDYRHISTELAHGGTGVYTENRLYALWLE